MKLDSFIEKFWSLWEEGDIGFAGQGLAFWARGRDAEFEVLGLRWGCGAVVNPINPKRGQPS